MRKLLHPRARTLRSWLSEDASAGVERHVRTCMRCADRLVHLDVEVEPALRQALLTALAPPAGALTRVAEAVDQRRQETSLTGLLFDAVGAGLDTLRLLIDEDGPDG